MTNLLKLICYLLLMTTTVRGYNPDRQTSMNDAVWNAHISPEILNELKDFQNLIPTVIIDEIVAEHYVIDGNFRKAFKYLRSQEFTQLQRQVLNLPEVVDVLEFLHLTTVNTTTSHMGATTADLITTDAVKAASFENDNNAAITTNPDSNVRTTANFIETTEGKAFYNKKTVHKRPHLSSVQVNNSFDDDIATSFNIKQALVSIVLLEDSVVRTNSDDDNDDDVTAYNRGHHLNNQHHHSTKYGRRHFSNNYQHHHDEHYQPLGTFTAFVEEVLQHLPHAAYQNMIKEKCQKNAKFAEFYKALRSQEFKPLVEQTLQTSNIKKVINTLNSHDVDVLALKPIAFQVISWGPNI